MSAKTRDEVSTLHKAWLARIERIQSAWETSPMEIVVIKTELAMAEFIMESGLTPETAAEWADSRLTAFEQSERVRIPPKTPRRKRAPKKGKPNPE